MCEKFCTFATFFKKSKEKRMITPNEYIQLKAFARQDGFFMGCLWIFTFGCFLGSMEQPDLQIGFMAGVILTPVLAYMRLKHFRDKVMSGAISYRRALAFMFLTLAYASMLIAAATYIYFYFFDNGLFLSTIQQNLSLPEIRQAFTDAGMNPKDLDTQIATIGETRPIDFALNIFCNGIICSTMLAAVLALFGRRVTRITA